MKIYKKYKTLINKIILITLILLSIFIYFKVDTINNIVNIVFIGFIFAYALNPIRNSISERFNISKRISSIILIIFIVTLILIMLYLVVPTILKESLNFGEMLDNIEKYISDLAIKLKINDISFFQSIYTQINEEVNRFLSGFSNNFIENMMGIFENLVSFAIVPIVTYYFLVDGDLIYNKILLILPTEKRVIAKKAINNIDRILSRYIISQLLLSLIIGVLTFIILMIIDVKFAFILAVLNGILNIIPYFGPIIGGIPAVIIALIDSPTKALWTIIGVFLLQQIEGNILSPKITGDSTNMHPIIIIILLLIGEKIGGFAGMVLAVPIGVIIKVIYDDINDYLF
ncbi:AI-2E family transporter [Clostridium chauvoei]|uniref:AI-2E family transporter n=3 Tax=Clostridium chauvoei TaxID=46867 RepID=A0ABD4RGQ2_9CLOT|nr:AI-2E family transporter [Clostridium chauvoei]ATD54876.1 AI-2E family transporter [Clostridium chauvoei]ATD57445.1 AI-2E family transporter [Clostridium chauvoei]MBX7280512.1 AI-2E family transporter [Clostridium chauvoei]MBX7282997.1 AI-2E family transporter [Clostridium chauvoei]MBX7285514.1 AI-2E family transporter [Clostridium chauvoei]